MTPNLSDRIIVTITQGDLVSTASVLHSDRLDFLAAVTKRALQEHLLKTGQPVSELTVAIR